MSILQNALATLRHGSIALQALQENGLENLTQVVEQILQLKGRLILSGMGKSGYIGRKIASSFASTGTLALYIHPAEASHGDLGMIAAGDMVILLSNSGQTSELNDIITYCLRFNIPIVGITMNGESNLARYATWVLLLPKIAESSDVGAPTTSCLMMLALGDAMVVATHQARGLSKSLYQSFHPGGNIGASLKPIASIMHIGDKIPLASLDTSMLEVILTMTDKSLGCCAIEDGGRLIGIITDGDLRRKINKDIFSLHAKDVMSSSPLVLAPTTLAGQALKIFNDKGITNCLVGQDAKLLGVVHIHDLLRIGVS
jgi:arabinose-5-phosphate isomerase